MARRQRCTHPCCPSVMLHPTPHPPLTGTIELLAVHQGALLPLHLAPSASLAAHPAPVQASAAAAPPVHCDHPHPRRSLACTSRLCHPAPFPQRPPARPSRPLPAAGPALAGSLASPRVAQHRKGGGRLPQHSAHHRCGACNSSTCFCFTMTVSLFAGGLRCAAASGLLLQCTQGFRCPMRLCEVPPAGTAPLRSMQTCATG